MRVLIGFIVVTTNLEVKDYRYYTEAFPIYGG